MILICMVIVSKLLIGSIHDKMLEALVVKNKTTSLKLLTSSYIEYLVFVTLKPNFNYIVVMIRRVLKMLIQ